MNIDTLVNNYPNLMGNFVDDIEGLRTLLVIDENEDDPDGENLDIFEPDEFNYLVYVTDAVQGIVGKEGMQRVVEQLESTDLFQNFYSSEIDLYGVKTLKDANDIANVILSVMEKEVS